MTTVRKAKGPRKKPETPQEALDDALLRLRKGNIGGVTHFVKWGDETLRVRVSKMGTEITADPIVDRLEPISKRKPHA